MFIAVVALLDYFQQQCIRFPFTLHPHQQFLLVAFLMVAILTGVK
jgi:hypothetical protein